jgi:hypothetical protein
MFTETKWCSLSIKISDFLTGQDAIFYGVLYWITILGYLSFVDSCNKKYYRYFLIVLLALLIIFFAVHIIAKE